MTYISSSFWDDQHPFYLKIYHRLNNQNNDFLSAVIGQKGDGKSWGALRIGERVDPDFSFDRNVAFSTDHLLEYLNRPEDDPMYLGKGSVVVLDEAGLGDTARAQEWWSKVNKDLDELLQTIRFRNLGFLLTTPKFHKISKPVRDMIVMKIVAYKDSGDYFLSPRWVMTKELDGFDGWAYPKWNGNRIKAIKMPDPEDAEGSDWSLRERYEKEAKKYKSQFYDRDRLSNPKKSLTYERIKRDVLNNIDDVSVRNRSHQLVGRRLINGLIRDKLGYSQKDLSKYRSTLDNDEDVLRALGRTDLLGED